MITCVSGKKIKPPYYFDINSVLTKSMIIFCWWMMVKMMMVTEKLPKIYERYSAISFLEKTPTSPISVVKNCLRPYSAPLR